MQVELQQIFASAGWSSVMKRCSRTTVLKTVLIPENASSFLGAVKDKECFIYVRERKASLRVWDFEDVIATDGFDNHAHLLMGWALMAAMCINAEVL